MSAVKYIMSKELARVFKDKRMIFSLFILPAILMFAIYGLMGTMISNVEADVSRHIPSIFVVNAPEGFKETAEGNSFIAEYTYIEEDEIEEVKDSIYNETADMLVVFPADYYSQVKAYSKEGDKIPEVTVYYNSTLDYSSAARSGFMDTVFNDYESKLLADRLGNLEALIISHVSTEKLEKEAKASGQFLSMMLPYLMVMLLFSSAMSIGVDAIAGEKERGTMASMLLTPIRRKDIVIGKIISLSILSMLSALVYSVSMIVAIPLMGNSMLDGATTNVSFSILQIIQLVVIMLSLVYLFVALIALISVFSKDVKQAQTYVSPVYIAVIFAGLLTMFTTATNKPVYSYAIPIYGNALAIKDILVNELTTVNFLASIGGIVVVAAILTAAVSKVFNNEKVMFNA